jgi:hypothetical protein
MPNFMPTHPLCGSNSDRQSVGDPGHCERCAQVGHVVAHPDLGCGDVGCYAAHGPDDPRDQEHEPAADTAANLPKRARTRYAQAELLIYLAMATASWSRQLLDQDPECKPFAEFPADDPLVMLCRKYDLTPADLARLCNRIGDSLETRADEAGYADRPEGGEYVRSYYRVPAHIGTPVRFEGRPGRVVGFDGPHLLVQFDAEPHPVPLHPTWHVTYPEGGDRG